MKKPVEKVETVDGRVYLSDDNWETVWVQHRRGNRRYRVTDKEEADLARFLAVSQSSGGPA